VAAKRGFSGVEFAKLAGIKCQIFAAWAQSYRTPAHQAVADSAGLAMLDDGVHLRGGKMRPWYEREEPSNPPAKNVNEV
jgi:hypothetical protein